MSEQTDKEKPQAAPSETEAELPTAPLPEPVVRHHEVMVNGKTLAYTTTTGMMPVRNEKGEIEARLWFCAYTLDGVENPGERPLTFTFNGGPGSASVWLHLGGLAPRRVQMLPDGGMPKPPFKLVDNDQTWLEQTDFVFIDPVDTGYSRATSEELAKKYKEVEQDIASVGEVIRLYLTKYRRWSSPLFLCGESYGTFRAAGLAGYLVERGIAFNGIILVSSILNMQTARFTLGNDLPYQLFLPTYAAIAWFHKQVPDDLQRLDVRAFLDRVEAWVESDYVAALSLGDRLDSARRDAVASQLAAFTGLSERYVRLSDLRIHIAAFCKELLRNDGRTVGRLDGRFKGYDRSGVSQFPDYDPSMNAIRPPFTTMLNDYMRRDLGFESDDEYHILRGLDWGWGDAGKGYPDTSEALRSAFAKNPYLRLYVASGYYDLATPYYATVYTLNHMALEPSLRDNIETGEYETGHMVYIDEGALAKLHDEVTAFIENAVKG